MKLGMLVLLSRIVNKKNWGGIYYKFERVR
jgi:hypothetical protein